MMSDFLRFGAVSGLGFILDLVLAIVLYEQLGLALWLAATVSFFAVAALNYILFEFWVFRRDGGTASGARAFGVLVASAVAACARIATILALTAPVTAVLGEGRMPAIVLLVAGAGVSLVVNYVINRRVVFRDANPALSDGKK